MANLKLITILLLATNVLAYWDSGTSNKDDPNYDPSCPDCGTIPDYMNWRATLRADLNQFKSILPVYAKTRGQGIVEGRSVPGIYDHNTFVNMYLGIPYARAPIDFETRFKPAQVYKRRDIRDTYPAYYYRPACPQIEDVMKEDIPGFSYTNEDCLYLNIFQPNRTGVPGVSKYPVMVFIHGGMYKTGSAIQFPGILLAQRDMVVVTFNYRLGPLGFLSMNDSTYPGNMGLTDQLMALRWVKENIENFAGDKNSITLVGHEAGAACVGIHLLSPQTQSLSDPYFHRAIMMSGSDLSQWAVIGSPEDGLEYTKRLAKLVGCDAANPGENMMQCLRTKHPTELVAAAESVPLNFDGVPQGSTAGPFAPIVDNYTDFQGWLSESPRELRKNMNNTKLMDVMGGFAKDDGVTILFKNFSQVFKNIQAGVDRDEFEFVTRNVTLRRDPIRINPDSEIDSDPGVERVQDAINYLYTWWPNKNNQTAQRKMLIDLFTDELYASGVDSALKSHSQRVDNSNKKVYMYKFDYRSTTEDDQTYWMGADLRSTVKYLFGWPMLAENKTYQAISSINVENTFTELDRNISNGTMRMWKDFAIYGDPTHQPLKQIIPYNFRNLTWYPLKLGNLTYFRIDDRSSNEKEYYQSRLAFWQDYIYDILYLPIFTTTTPTPTTWSYEGYEIAVFSLSAVSAVILIILILIIILLFKRRPRRQPNDYFHNMAEF